MRSGWVYACDTSAGIAVVAHLAELGYTPYRPVVAAPDGVAAELSRAAEPDVIVVAAGVGSLPIAAEIVSAVRTVEEIASVPVVLALESAALTVASSLPLTDELLVIPASSDEMGLRIERALQRLGRGVVGDVVRFGALELNLATYGATVDGRSIAFTHMEYELLRFLATHPNRVFSREALLDRVWGYDFYGATRTVDVHVRRVRAKLGREHAGFIRTVRSVGYRFEP